MRRVWSADGVSKKPTKEWEVLEKQENWTAPFDLLQLMMEPHERSLF